MTFRMGKYSGAGKWVEQKLNKNWRCNFLNKYLINGLKLLR